MSLHRLAVARLELHAYPAVIVGERAAALKLKRGLALLALLADSTRPICRQRLAELLLPDAAVAVGRGRLRRLVHELHSALGCALMQSDADALWLGPGCTSDLQATAVATEAVLSSDEIRAGELARLLAPGSHGVLDGFELDDSEAFAEWLAGRRLQHEGAWRRALEHAAELAAAERDAPLLDTLATRLLQRDACAESGHAARMTACALRGDGAGLEVAYHDAAQRLREELGVRPSARLEAAYAAAQHAAARCPRRTHRRLRRQRPGRRRPRLLGPGPRGHRRALGHGQQPRSGTR